MPVDRRTQARLEQLLRDYGAKVRALLASHGLEQFGIDPADVEQEVRIRLWRAVERDRDGAFHASYIQRVVASTVVDALRRAKVRAAEPLPEDDSEPIAFGEAAPGPERLAGGGQEARSVFACLSELPERRRAPIALFLQGFSLQEVADVAGVSAEAARKLVSRGIDDLKTRLREQGFGEFDD